MRLELLALVAAVLAAIVFSSQGSVRPRTSLHGLLNAVGVAPTFWYIQLLRRDSGTSSSQK
jgi:hypothetical protein